MRGFVLRSRPHGPPVDDKLVPDQAGSNFCGWGCNARRRPGSSPPPIAGASRHDNASLRGLSAMHWSSLCHWFLHWQRLGPSRCRDHFGGPLIPGHPGILIEDKLPRCSAVDWPQCIKRVVSGAVVISTSDAILSFEAYRQACHWRAQLWSWPCSSPFHLSPQAAPRSTS